MMPVLREEKSLLIHTAVMPVMAAAHFQEKTRQKLTALLHMLHAGWQKILLRQVLQANVKLSLHTLSASAALFQFLLIRLIQAKSMMSVLQNLSKRILTFVRLQLLNNLT